MTPPPPSSDIVELLIDREARASEQRIHLVRGLLIMIALGVLMPIRIATYGLDGGAGNLRITLAVLVGGLLATILLGWRMRDPKSPRSLSFIGILLDFGIVAGLIAGQIESGYTPSVRQSIETYQLILPIGYTMNALSGLRLSRRQALVSGLCCLALIAESVWIDTVLHGAPFYGFTTILLASLVGVITLGSYFTVTKTRRLIQEASQMESESRRVRNVLARYVSKPVAEEVLKEDLSLSAGVRQRVTVMFTDIRGFTSMSEELSPEEVVAFLNSYFSRMVGIVFAHEGMLDKYIGDGLMAVFGAPIPQEDHALRAVKAALQMREELARLNDELRSQGRSPLSIGIGLHTGECIIGNIGSADRLDYTAIGDTVNTASRIEGLTKTHGVDLLISSETYSEVAAQVEAERLPAVPLRGKTARLDLFIVKSLRSRVARTSILRRSNSQVLG